MPPRISVLIPAYNRADLIYRAINAVKASDYPVSQVIVSDNGSSDGTLEAAQQAAAGDPRFTFIQHAANLGPLPNWRSCLEAAQGEYIHWLWSDDWVAPTFYSSLVEGMARVQARVGVSAQKIMCEAAGWEQFCPVPEGLVQEARPLLHRALRHNALPFSPAACLLPLESVREHFYDAIPAIGSLDCTRRAIGCDVLMILGSLLNTPRVYTHPEALAFFNAHEGSISVSSNEELLMCHYAWARVWWSRKMGLPRSWNRKDLKRLWRNGHRKAALLGLC